MARSSAVYPPQDRYCFTFTGFALEHNIKKRTKFQQVTTQFVSSISYNRVFTKYQSDTGHIIDIEAEEATPKPGETRCMVVGLLICTADGRPCFDYTENQVAKARSVEAEDPRSCVDLPSGSEIWRVVVPTRCNKRAGIKMYALGVKEDGCSVFLPLICKQEYVFFYSEFRGGETTVLTRRKGWIERIWKHISEITTAEDIEEIPELPNASAFASDVQRDISPMESLSSTPSIGSEQSSVIELSDRQTSDRDDLQQREGISAAFNNAQCLPTMSAVWSYLNVSNAEESDESCLRDDRSITSNRSRCSDSDHSSCSSKDSVFNDTSYIIEKDRHSFTGTDDEYAAILTELLDQWPYLISSISVDILRYLRRGLEQNSTTITCSMVPAFFSHGERIMHKFRDEIIKTFGNHRDDLLRDLVATIVDDIKISDQLRTCTPPHKSNPQATATDELLSMIQERILNVSKIDRNLANSQIDPDWRPLLGELLDCVEVCRDAQDVESLKEDLGECIAWIKRKLTTKKSTDVEQATGSRDIWAN